MALAAWGVAIVGGGITTFIPPAVLRRPPRHALRGRHARASLRTQVAALAVELAALRTQNATLQQRFALSEQSGNEVTRRVGALELSVPRLLEAATAAQNQAIDRGTITGSTGTGATMLPADGGSVGVRTIPLDATGTAHAGASQPLPAPIQPVRGDATTYGVALGAPVAPGGGQAAWQHLGNRVVRCCSASARSGRYRRRRQLAPRCLPRRPKPPPGSSATAWRGPASPAPAVPFTGAPLGPG